MSKPKNRFVVWDKDGNWQEEVFADCYMMAENEGWVQFGNYDKPRWFLPRRITPFLVLRDFSRIEIHPPLM